MQTKLLRCDVCGVAHEGPAEDWYALHFGVSSPCVLVEPSETDSQRLGEKHACSRKCLIKLVVDWADSWRAKREKEVRCVLTS
ncbi:MAG TPA: hypothetical protein VH601_16685 [Bryobacteraceae bacterium]|jgi:hypothetical protein